MLNALYHSVDPIAFSVGPVKIYWYGIAYVVGAALVGVIMHRTQRRWDLNISDDELYCVTFAAVLGLLIGARLFYIVFYGDGYYFSHPAEILSRAGMSFHGGLVGGIVGGYLACRKLNLSAWTIADLAATGVPAALFLGRCANFVNGELWGKPTDLPWGVVFGGAAGNVARHPSQLYEAGLEGIVLLAILYILSRRRPALPQGTYIGVFVFGYGIARFIVEFVRVPDAQLGYLFANVVTMGQILSLPLIAIGACLIAFALRARRPQRKRMRA
ncbi:prolipoprotein diacylglyceryl transferase [Coriobacterium glomerans PW2]|uniref:Phosphatidylglycerol--prolipoprotein diacylglyceryl transferase n=1 Tax=Coriobacterium glomerans (strain ATCC 49209 / DSM 20642 / JCM 10262 / PW2) TaxID=700015 RepID=F2N757_CORGP|nr:prolipoprotein diacylglyceryl transferase [Coriobacterium glomerans]AEB06396.1 prolipoprotein diacylglyceryl transferase [Coriobacterium glomerans PW2]